MSSSFMDQMKHLHSAEYQNAQRRKEIIDRGNYYINCCIIAVKEAVRTNYHQRCAAGFVSRNCGYDNPEHHLLPDAKRSSEARKTCADCTLIPDERELIAYIQSELPKKIRALGLSRFNVRIDRVEEIRINNRDLLCWVKYGRTGQFRHIVYIELNW